MGVTYRIVFVWMNGEWWVSPIKGNFRNIVNIIWWPCLLPWSVISQEIWTVQEWEPSSVPPGRSSEPDCELGRSRDTECPGKTQSWRSWGHTWKSTLTNKKVCINKLFINKSLWLCVPAVVALRHEGPVRETTAEGVGNTPALGGVVNLIMLSIQAHRLCVEPWSLYIWVIEEIWKCLKSSLSAKI